MTFLWVFIYSYTLSISNPPIKTGEIIIFCKIYYIFLFYDPNMGFLAYKLNAYCRGINSDRAHRKHFWQNCMLVLFRIEGQRVILGPGVWTTPIKIKNQTPQKNVSEWGLNNAKVYFCWTPCSYMVFLSD